MVYLGGLGDEGGPSAHLDSRHEVGRILRDKADTVELRAAIVIGPAAPASRSSASWWTTCR